MNIIQALNWRYAVRQFASENIDAQQVQELLTATRLSATSYGLQPYRLITVNDLDVRKKLLEYSTGQDKVLNCSHLIVIAAQTSIDNEMIEQYIRAVADKRNTSVKELQGFENHMKDVFADKTPSQKQQWAHQQAYIALGTLLAAAALMKIDTCPMGGFEADGFDQVLGLDKMGLESVVICALGVRHPDDLSAKLAKVRYDHEKMVIAV